MVDVFNQIKVFVYPADETGCGYYRLIWPAQTLQAQGFDVTVVTKNDHERQFKGKVKDGVMLDVVLPPGVDVIVLQRPTHELLYQAIPLMRRKGVAVVVDMDDDLTCIDPRNPAWGAMHPRATGEHSWTNTRPACDNATLVTVSTPALLNVYARKTEGVVLPNRVPTYFTQIEHVDSPTVGWGGTVLSHPDDLQSMGPALSRLIRATGSFTVVGPEGGLNRAVGESLAKQMTVTGGVQFLEWSHALAKNIGVGVAPIANTRFNEAKSWLKPLEYAAVGVPPISSSRTEYVKLRDRYGIGLIATSPKDWYRQVMKLVNDASLRTDLGASWRQIVVDRLTIERNVDEWASAWRRALQIQRN